MNHRSLFSNNTARPITYRRIVFSLMFMCSTIVSSAEDVGQLFTVATMGQLDKVEETLASGIDINQKTDSGRTGLMGAAAYGNFRIAKMLIAYGADFDLADNRGSTALMDAVVFGHYEIIELLINVGSDVNAVDSSQKSVLDKAKIVGNKKIIALLEKAGAQAGEGSAENESNEKK